MKLLVLHGSNDRYGASGVLTQDVEILTAAGHAVEVVLPAEGPLTQVLEQVGARVTVGELSVFRKVDGVRALRLPTSLPLTRDTPDAVVVWTLALASYLPLLRARRIPTVSSVHEILPGSAGRVLATLAIVLSRSVMTNSEATTRWLLRGGSRSNAVRAYPIAPDFSPAPVRPEPTDAIRLLLAGRINGHKGHLEAIRAVDIVRSRGIEAELRLVGAPFPGQEHHEERLRELAVDRPWVTLTGELPDLRDELERCEVMLVPTTRPEPFGIVAQEAWAAGRRVIATDGGGLAEAARLVGGSLVPMGDVDALAASIVRHARYPELRAVPTGHEPVARLCTRDERVIAWNKVLSFLRTPMQRR